jgi:hypothetical protein
MQCLRCTNEAIPGKALCASCFAAHQKNLEFEGSEEWVEQQLAATRNESRERKQEVQGPETSTQGLVLTLAPALLILGGLTMFSVWFVNNVGFKFTPTADSKQSQGTESGPSKGTTDGSAANSAEQPPPSQNKQAPAAPAEDSRDNPDYKVSEPTPTRIPEPSATPTSTANPTSTPTPIPTESPDPL